MPDRLPLPLTLRARPQLALLISLGACFGLVGVAGAQTSKLPITGDQRATAERVAQDGVPLSALAANAPDSHTVKPGDTLWDISKIFLTSPWRWPELWGMNREQIANPHLIYPGQVLFLVKSNGRARLQLARNVGKAGDTVRLSPRVRSSALDAGAIGSVSQKLIEPFLSEAIVLDEDSLAAAPRIVAAQESRVYLSKGELAYARGDFSQATDWRIFRTAKPLRDPVTNEVLGYEARYVGTAELIRQGETRQLADGKEEIVPATLRLKDIRVEAGAGDRLSPVPQRNFPNYVPHAPAQPIKGQIIALYGDALYAGQNQIVSLNKGQQDGLEAGHVLALWRDGRRATDRTSENRDEIKLPDERNGVLFVFRVYSRVSYALLVTVQDVVSPGDRFSEP